VFTGVDGIQADDFSGEVEAKDLFLPFVINNIAFETAGAYGRNGTEFVTSTKQVFAWLDGAGAVNNLFKSLGFISA